MWEKSLFAAYFTWFVISVSLTTVAPIILGGYSDGRLLNPVILLGDFLMAIPLYLLYRSAFGQKKPGKPNMLKKAFFVCWSLSILAAWVRVLMGNSPLTDGSWAMLSIPGLFLFTLMLYPLYEWAFKGES